MHEDLIAGALRGDREALASLIAEDEAALTHFLRRRLGEADAADAVRDVVRRVISGLTSLREPRAYRGWLFGIAVRVAQEAGRSPAAGRPLGEEQQSPGEGPALQRSGETQIRAQVRSAVDALEVDLRTAVLLRYEQGLSTEELAQAIRRRVGTVSKRLHTAHMRLLQSLAGAGAVVALGMLTEVLGAVEVAPLPEPLSQELRRLVLETAPPGPKAGYSLVPRAVVVALPLVLGLLIVAFFIRGRAAREVLAPLARAPIDQPSSSAAGSSRIGAREERVTGGVPDRERASVLLKGGGVGGQVLNDRGAPLSGARVFAASPTSGRFLAVSLTSHEGAFSFPDLDPSVKFLIACFPGTGVATAQIVPGEPRRMVMINHDASSRVSGVVSDFWGYPLGGATVMISSYDLALPGLEAKISFKDAGAGISGTAADREGRPDVKVVQGFMPPSWGYPEATSRPSGQFDLEQLGLGPGVTATAMVHKPGYASASCTLAPDGPLVLVRLRKLGE